MLFEQQNRLEDPRRFTPTKNPAEKPPSGGGFLVFCAGCPAKLVRCLSSAFRPLSPEMSRILFFVLLAFLVWLWFFKKPARSKSDKSKPAEPVAERIVQCAECGLRIPEGEAVFTDAQYFCCPEHRDAHNGRV